MIQKAPTKRPIVRPATEAPGHGRRRGFAVLAAAGVLSAINGAAHFLLPVLYPWEQHVEQLYEPIRWALFATTIFFGVLLLLGGLLTIAVAAATGLPVRVIGWVAGGMALFWLAGAAYEIAVPFPAPVAEWALPVFSGLVASLYLVGLWLRTRPGHSGVEKSTESGRALLERTQ